MKKIYLLILALFSIAIFSSCSDEITSADDQNNDNPSEAQIEDPEEVLTPCEFEFTEAELNIATSNNDFAWKFFNQNTLNSEGNVVISPLSVTIAMTMMANGAYEDSPVRSEILGALGFADYNISDVNSTVMKLAQGINGLDEEVTVDLANSLWVDNKKFTLNTEYVSILKKDFFAECYPIVQSTFIADVNRWCETKTRGLIDRILPDNFTVPLMALVNATYFKGLWNPECAFKEENTKEGDFYCKNGSVAKVDFLNTSAFFQSRKTDNFEMISMPFGKGSYNFNVILPNTGIEIEECQEDMLSGQWNNLISKEPKVEYLDLKLPKFDVEYGKDLVDILSDLGMQKAMHTRDFYFAYFEGLEIKEILQKSRLRINEEGGEAAAVTIVIPEPISPENPVNVDPDKPRPFYLDHPFIYLITEKETGTILFMGSINQF